MDVGRVVFGARISARNMDGTRADNFHQAVPRGASGRIQISDLCRQTDGKLRPFGNWLENWYDGFHEADGGNDERGVQPPNGTKIFEEEKKAWRREMEKKGHGMTSRTLLWTPRR